jgi:hypothetical protein
MDYARMRIAALTRELLETANMLRGRDLTVARLKKSIKNFRRECDTLRECEALHHQSDTDHQILAKTLHSCIIDILKARADVDTRGRRVDETLLNIFFVLQSYSHTGYEFMCQYLPVPNRKTIYRHFLDRIRVQEEYCPFIWMLALYLKIEDLVCHTGRLGFAKCPAVYNTYFQNRTF